MRKKLNRFRANASLDNLLERGKPRFETLRGRWRQDVFGHDRPLTVELGCGSGEFATALAARHPDRNIAGVDRRGARMWVGASDAIERGLSNVVFLRADVAELERFFAPGEIDELWLTFPDPRPKTKQAKHRLTAPGFLETYRRVLAPGSWVRFKTDDDALFEYTLGQVQRDDAARRLTLTRDLHGTSALDDPRALQTRYERRFLEQGLTIKYLEFQYPAPGERMTGRGDTTAARSARPRAGRQARYS